MNIWFEKIQSELILCYRPDRIDVNYVYEGLEKFKTWKLKNTFYFTPENQRNVTQLQIDSYRYSLYDSSILFCVGELIDGYYRLDPKVFNTIHTFYIQNVDEFKFEGRMFVCYNNISIIRKIDHLVDSDVYIGNDSAKPGYLAIEQYKLLVSQFPGTAELKYYAHARIAATLHEYFDDSDAFIRKYDRFLESKRSIKRYTAENIFLQKEDNDVATRASSAVVEGKLYELEQFKSIFMEFGVRLKGQYSETQWQPFIKDVIRFVFPKYIMSIEKVRFDGINRNDDDSKREPDFVLIDTNGFVDILEIKTPEVQYLTARPSYRKNFIPTRELSGAIQQIEKYIFCLNQSSQKNTERILQKVGFPLPKDVSLQIMNPQGLLILGRSNRLNNPQKRDFELIKRQYKHIVEIMTYDDLYARLKNITHSLEKEIAVLYPNANV